MKKTLFALLTLGSLTATVPADDVAVLQFKTGPQTQRVVLEFYEESAPLTVANFKKLAGSGFYTVTAIHRVFPHLMVQAGDPLSKQKGNPGIGTGGPGYTLAPEIGRKQIAGAVAAARLPDKINPARRSNGSQFFITVQPMPNLDGEYTVFAHVVEGLDVLDKISQETADTNDSPVSRILLTSVRIVPREQVQPSGAPGKNWLQRNFQCVF